MSVPILLTGWFSVDSEGNTGGDLLALESVAGWLRGQQVPYAVAVSDPVRYSEVMHHPTVPADDARPEDVDGLVWVCGPLPDGKALVLLDRFAERRRLALGVSVTDPDLEHRFDTVIARDRPDAPGRPDLSLATRTGLVPVLGLIYVGPQPEYSSQQEPAVREVVGRVLGEGDCAVVDIDTRLPLVSNRLRTPAQLESVIARMDIVITTRVHGALLALRNRVPVVALDAVSGGAKLSAQMHAVGWPLTVTVDHLTDDRLRRLLDQASSGDVDDDLARIAAIGEPSLATYHDALAGWIDELTGRTLKTGPAL